MASQPAAETLARWPQLSHWLSSVSDEEQPIAHSRQPRRSGAERKVKESTVLSRRGLAIGPGGREPPGIVFGGRSSRSCFGPGGSSPVENGRPTLAGLQTAHPVTANHGR